LARLLLTRRIARSLSDSGASCTFVVLAQLDSPGQRAVKCMCVLLLLYGDFDSGSLLPRPSASVLLIGAHSSGPARGIRSGGAVPVVRRLRRRRVCDGRRRRDPAGAADSVRRRADLSAGQARPFSGPLSDQEVHSRRRGQVCLCVVSVSVLTAAKASRAPAAVHFAGIDRPRNKPRAPEWRIIYIYEQARITYDGWNVY